MAVDAASNPLPVLLSVDDDAQVLDAVGADLRARYGSRYRVVTAASGEDALAAVERLTRRGGQLAAVVADQRMPGMSGTELLVAAKRLQPRLRSVLLTAYADTDAAITAINEVSLDHYIVKPWDPPEEHLYPVLDELLEEWQATRPRAEAGLRLVGDRWSAASHRLRDFLARNQLPFRWVDVDHADAVPLLAAAGARRACRCCCSRTAASCPIRHGLTSPPRWDSRPARRSSSTTSSSSVQVRRDWRPRSTAPPRASPPWWWRRGARRAGIAELAHRELPRFPLLVCPARSSRAGRSPRRAGSAPRSSPPTASSACGPRTPTGS